MSTQPLPPFCFWLVLIDKPDSGVTPPVGSIWVDKGLWIQTPVGPFDLDEIYIPDPPPDYIFRITGRDNLPKITLSHGIVVPPGKYHGFVRDGLLTNCACEVARDRKAEIAARNKA